MKRFQSTVEDVLHYLKEGNAPQRYNDFPDSIRVKRMHTLRQYALGFTYDKEGL